MRARQKAWLLNWIIETAMNTVITQAFAWSSHCARFYGLGHNHNNSRARVFYGFHSVHHGRVSKGFRR
jgi:hypothetical protein